jgi:hypothetical protein
MDKMERTGRSIRGIISKLTGRPEIKRKLTPATDSAQDNQKAYERGLRAGRVDIADTFDAMRQHVFDAVIKKGGVAPDGDFTAYLVAVIAEHPDVLQTLSKTWTNRIIKTDGNVLSHLAHSVAEAGIAFDESLLEVFQLIAKNFVDDHWASVIADDILGVMGNADDVIAHYEHVFGRPNSKV